MKKLFLLTLIFGSYIPTNAEQYPIHKYTCPDSGGECNEEERAVVKLVNDKYWKILSDRIKENKFYKYPWYWVYKRKDCKYEVAAKEDMSTHTANMEWIDVDICEKTTKLINLGRRSGEVKDGFRESFHPNGSVWMRSTMKDGKMNGLWEEYRDDGTLGMRVMMIDGKAEGLWEVFHENGQIYYAKNYINGIEEDGLFSAFFDNGQLRWQGNMKDGGKDGIWEYFNKDGSLKKAITFENGKVIGSFTPSKNTKLCTLTSEKESDITITMNYPSTGYGYGTLNYKNEPQYYFEVGISNGYGTQYYQLRTYSAEASYQYSGLPYAVRTKDTELISNGRFVNFVGNKLARSTTRQERRKGTMKALMPTLPSDYYYSLTNNHKKGEYGRFNLSPKMKAILSASEGFFIDSGGCRKYFKYGWD